MESILYSLRLSDQESKYVNDKSFGKFESKIINSNFGEIGEYIGVKSIENASDAYFTISTEGIILSKTDESFLIPFNNILQISVGVTVLKRNLPKLTDYGRSDGVDFDSPVQGQNMIVTSLEKMKKQPAVMNEPRLSFDINQISLYIHHTYTQNTSILDKHMEHQAFHGHINQIVLPIGFKDIKLICSVLHSYTFISAHDIFATKEIKEQIQNFEEKTNQKQIKEHFRWIVPLIFGFGVNILLILYDYLMFIQNKKLKWLLLIFIFAIFMLSIHRSTYWFKNLQLAP